MGIRTFFRQRFNYANEFHPIPSALDWDDIITAAEDYLLQPNDGKPMLPAVPVNFETPYIKAFAAFKQSSDYHRCMTIMFEKNILFPYSENILRVAFDAAWNSKV